jgi:tuftelin-interacting protein 11
VTGGAAASLTSSGRLRPEEITFRSIAEEYVAARDLIWVPTGRSDVATGQMLFRVSRDGISGGVLCYVLDDAVYVSEPLAGPGGESLFKAVTLEGLVARAKGGVGAGK